MVAQLDSRYLKTSVGKSFVRLVSYALFEGRPVTARGRWVNPMVFLFLGALGRLPRLHRVDRPIFIIGTGRSGTTVLGKVLSMHRAIGFLNEPKALWHSVLPSEDVIGNYGRGPAHYRLLAEHADRRVQTRATRLYGGYLALTRSQRVLDKYPEMVFRLPFLQRLFPDSRFLLLVRNGMDTCASIASWSEKHSRTRGAASEDWWGRDRRKWRLLVEQLVPEDPDLAPLADSLRELSRDVDMAAVEWILAMREGLSHSRRQPRAVHVVRFEELSRNPRAELETILGFCRLDGDRRFLDYALATLKPVRSWDPVDIDDRIRPAFDAVMRDLGYS